MNYTHQFLELPTILFDSEAKDMGLQYNSEVVPLKINVLEIEAWAMGFKDPEEGSGECVNVFMKSHRSHRIELTLKQFEKRLNEFCANPSIQR